MSEISTFRVEVPEAAIRDLHSRIQDARWPEKEPVSDWSQGVPLAELQSFVAYWSSGYDWRRLEAEINSFGNYRMLLDGLGIHFIHAESKHANALPLILTHGWPGSIVEFLDCIGPLIDPVKYGGAAEDAFHVVVPSLPGFGFSDRPREPGWSHWSPSGRQIHATRSEGWHTASGERCQEACPGGPTTFPWESVVNGNSRR